MTAWYNEVDPKAAAWLRELISCGLIAPGVVDERDVRDVRPADLHGFAQCHFFAGIGVWSYALRRAGWPDDRPVWTGSCPCQPFSAAGKGAGFDDERHLWPSWFWLIDQCRPGTLFGEQVASKDAEPWLDLVQDDLEAVGYAFGACAFPAAGIGAPHIRDRTYWVADADDARSQGRIERGNGAEQWPAGAPGVAGRMANADQQRHEPIAGGFSALSSQAASIWHDDIQPEPGGAVGREQPGAANGLWRNADWLLCRDGRWRPVEPGTFPLAHGAPARVGRLRGYGNAINAEAAVAWVESYLG